MRFKENDTCLLSKGMIKNNYVILVTKTIKNQSYPKNENALSSPKYAYYSNMGPKSIKKNGFS